MGGSKRQGSVGDMVGYWMWEGVTIRKCGGYGGVLDVEGSNDKEVWGIWWASLLDVGGSKRIKLNVEILVSGCGRDNI